MKFLTVFCFTITTATDTHTVSMRRLTDDAAFLQLVPQQTIGEDDLMIIKENKENKQTSI